MALVGNPWSEQMVTQMCEMLAERQSHAQIAAALGVPRKSIGARVHRMALAGDPRLPAERNQSKRIAREIPADFAEHATLHVAVLIQRYHVGKHTIAKWRKEVGKPGRTEYRAKPLPDDFVELAPRLTLDEARARFGVAPDLLRRWENRTGVKLRRIRTALPAGRLKMDRDNRRDMSRAGLAADFLRRFGPVFRCDRHGKPSEKGTHWARGRYVLSADEIIDRAERNGWKPDAWRIVTTPTTTEGSRP